MRGFPVYRIDPADKAVMRIGSILEFRRSRRSMNRLGLAKLAQKVFALYPGDIIIVGTDSNLARAEIAVESQLSLSAG